MGKLDNDGYMTDAELMLAICRQDAEAFETLAARHRGQLARYLQRMVRDFNTAEDLQQEVLLRVWTRAEQWEERGNVRAWLFRIATNLALNHLRSQRRRRELPLLPSDSPEMEDDDLPVPAWMIDTARLTPAEQAERSQRQALLDRLIAGLPEEKRNVIRLVHEAEMNLRAVASQLAIPEGTVKSRLYHARKQLAREWHDFDAEEDLL